MSEISRLLKYLDRQIDFADSEGDRVELWEILQDLRTVAEQIQDLIDKELAK